MLWGFRHFYGSWLLSDAGREKVNKKANKRLSSEDIAQYSYFSYLVFLLGSILHWGRKAHSNCWIWTTHQIVMQVVRQPLVSRFS